MYDMCHPDYYNIGQLGCNDHVRVTAAFYAYLELCEAKVFWDVEYFYNKDLDLLYLKGQQTKNHEWEIYIPWPANTNITILEMELIQKHLESKEVTFIFKSGDSTSVYYKVTSGLEPPVLPETTRLLRVAQEEQMMINREIVRNIPHLYELAKSASSSNEDKDGDQQMSDSKSVEEIVVLDTKTD